MLVESACCTPSSVLAGPHPRSLLARGAAPRRVPPAPRSGRRRFFCARGAPPPLAARSRAPLPGAPLRPLARAAGASSVLAGLSASALSIHRALRRDLAAAGRHFLTTAGGPSLGVTA